MLTLPPSVQVHLAVEPVDLRKSFDALASLVREQFGQEPMSGHLFVFRSRRRRMIKVLFWDRTGWVLLAKRLVKGCFELPVEVPEGRTVVQVEAAQLALMLEGIDLRGAAHRPRWVPKSPGLRV